MKYFITVLILSTPLFMQAHELEGQVIDAFGIPVADVYIFSQDQSIHCHTNQEGNFQSNDFEVGDSLIVKHIGYEDFRTILTEQDFAEPMTIILNRQFVDLTEISVSAAAKSIREISRVDLIEQPVRSSQEILRKVPGLIIGQHAGGGKAEQIFLRGFDIDHGTDITLSVDDMPVNMVSHAHGQGYSDFHFVIPELIETIDYGKGPYYSEKGNFSTAGHVNMQTKKRLDESKVGIDIGSFNMRRFLAMVNAIPKMENHSAYVAAELTQFDGAFDSPQNFNRLNLVGKYHTSFNDYSDLTLSFSTFTSDWDASGQIPQRLVDQRVISRFGAVDDTEGGTTSRNNVNLEMTTKLAKDQFISMNAYYSKYKFDLYSNFTFFLNDEDNGDQIRQLEDRNLYGFNAKYFSTLLSGPTQLTLTSGIGIRMDEVNDNQLVRTISRRLTNNFFALGNVDESNWFGYAEATLASGDFTISAGLRADAFSFGYHNLLDSLYNREIQRQSIISPKLSILYQANPNLTVFLKTGRGFHSNDSRVVVQRQSENTLPYALGADLGLIWKLAPNFTINTALWHLYLEQEFVYVGDEGIVEPSDETTRSGVDFGLQYQISDELEMRVNANYAHARFIGVAEGEDYIPLAPDFTTDGGLIYSSKSGFTASIFYRYVNDRPANEDNSIVAEGYFITDLAASYRWKNISIGIQIENLFDQEWNETQFATNSRLLSESEPVEEIHFTPGTPFFMRVSSFFHF